VRRREVGGRKEKRKDRKRGREEERKRGTDRERA